MSRSSFILAPLLAAGLVVLACSDRRSSGPTAIAERTVSFDREPETGAHAHIVQATGHAEVDVPAVQAAVDRGGSILLLGHFAFDASANIRNAIATDLVPLKIPAYAQVKITKAVQISGRESDNDGDMTTIEGGMIPFYIEAPGQAVTIRRLRFVRPISHAILVFAAGGLEITSNKIDGLQTFAPNINGAISVLTSGAIPSPTKPGKTGNVSGNIIVADNDFDLAGGTTADNVLGITVFSVGDTATPVDVRVTGNRIRNTTEPAINFRRAVGMVRIEHNTISTGTVGVPDARSSAIRVANLGSFLIAHNTIACNWAVADAAGIGVFSQFASWPIERAVVEDNRIAMSPPQGTAFSAFSAGIAVYGFANDNSVSHNQIRGRALAGISVPEFPLSPPLASPTDNQFIRNVFVRFTPADSDFFVGAHAVDTRIVGPGGVDTPATSTIVVRPGRVDRVARHSRSR
jgi:hypothetical protein